ncbi:hypothetical protein [Okeania sp.]|uniref:hypothetical protein n=1 Tax=Okeania sp. TaxID=3100323 RepID=UPI002B4B3FAB|nr:hypothetical protein [Okeania sp.]MEB3340792.1 hypothetical protein [Okeania sp.]
MSNQKRSPNPVRYFLARFSHLTKPLVWGPIGVAALVLLFAWELSVHPEWLAIEDDDNDDSVSNGNAITETLSPEEASVINDIGNSSVLKKELEAAKQQEINALQNFQINLLDRLEEENAKKSNKEKKATKPEEYIAKPLPKVNIYESNKSQNLSPKNQPLVNKINLLEPTNKEAMKEKPVNALQTAMDNYLGLQTKSESSSNDQSQTNNINLSPTEIKPKDIKPSPFVNIPRSNISKSQETSNFNSVSEPINVTPPKPYYTDLSGGVNQTNSTHNPTNLPSYNYSLQRQSTNPNLPPLNPVTPNGLINNQNQINGVNNYYGNQVYTQNQQQQYNYGVNPNQVNQNLSQTPQNNPDSTNNNNFNNRGYSQPWNNPFKNQN